jgi:hypothetical protein
VVDDQLVFTQAERTIIDRYNDYFNQGARAHAKREGGEDFEFHPEFWPYIQRTLYEYSLRQCGWQNSDDWKVAIASYLKAWMHGVSPSSLLDVSELLKATGHANASREALDVVGLFPAFVQSRPAEDAKWVFMSAVTVGA